MLLTYALTALILGAWATRCVFEQRLVWRRTPLDLPLAIFLGSQLLSTILSIHPRTSFFGYYTRFHGGLLSTLTYLCLYYAFVSNVTRKEVKHFLISVLIAAAGVCLYAIPEHFGHSPSCWLITGGEMFDVTCWVQDVKTRVFATFGQPNWLAAYVIMVLPLTLSLMMTSTEKLGVKKASYLVLSWLLVLTLIFTKSRSGLLGMVIGVGIWGLGYLWLWSRRHLTPQAFAPLVIFGTISLGLFFQFDPYVLPLLNSKLNLWRSDASQIESSLATPAPSPLEVPAVINRLDIGGTDSGEIRKIVWEGAISVWQRYPLFGSGVETFAYSYYQDRPLAHNLVSEWDFLYNKAHNEFLNFLATTGLVGLGAYIGVLLLYGSLSGRTILAASSDYNHSSPSSSSETIDFAPLITLGLVTGLISLSVSNFFGFSTVMVTVLHYLFMACYVVLNYSPPAVTSDHSVKTPELSASQIGGLIVIGGLTFFLLSQVVTMWQADAAYTRAKAWISAGKGTPALEELEAAIRLQPKEALFYDELSDLYSQLAVASGQQGQSSASAEIAQAALKASEITLNLNPRHLNFYKTRARILISLSGLDPHLLTAAEDTLHQALELAPTDAKLLYNLALVQLNSDDPGKQAEGLRNLEKTLEMKPNYESARRERADQYLKVTDYDRAYQEYEYIVKFINPNNAYARQQLESLNASISGQPSAK